MNLFVKISICSAAAVLSTAIASATTYQFGSYATGQPNMGNQNTALTFDTVNSTQDPGVVYSPNTVAVDPGPIVWHAALPNTTWVSFGQTGPTTPAASQPGGHFAPNGDYLFTSTFTLDSQATSFVFSVLADDTVAVYLDGQTGNALIKPSSGNNIICNTDQPNCKDVDTVTQLDAPAALALLTAGTHTMTFDVQQIRSVDVGVDFSATVVTGGVGPSVIPEPSSLLLMGTGLIGSAGAFLRRTRSVLR